MQKKITSSLVIAAYCLNSLPVFAGPIAPVSSGIGMESTLSELGPTSTSVRVSLNPWEREKQKRLREASSMLKQSTETARKNGWGSPEKQKRSGRVSREAEEYIFCVSLSPDSSPKLSEGGRIMRNYFIKDGLEGEEVYKEYNKNSKKQKIHSCYSSKKNPFKMSFEKEDMFKIITTYLQNVNFGKEVQIFSLDEDVVYSYIKFIPDFDNVLKDKSSAYGKIALTASDFSDELQRLNSSDDPVLLSSLNGKKKKWDFFLSPGNGKYVSLGSLPYNGTADYLNIDTLRTSFLKDYNDGKFERVKDFFESGVLALPTEGFTTHSTPLPSSSLNTTSSYDAIVPTQAPHTASDNSLIWGSVTVVITGVVTGGILAAVYHWWKGKKSQGRNGEYDRVVYN